jgi:hypothetical protein
METCKYLFISNLFKDLAIYICQKLPNHAIFAKQVIQMFAFLRKNVTNIDSTQFSIFYSWKCFGILWHCHAKLRLMQIK